MFEKKAIGRSTDYLTAVSALLRAEAGGSNDYSGILVLTPTAEAGRLLRENLAKSDGAVGLTIMMPNVLFTPSDTADDNETLYNWLKTLSAMDRRDEALLFRGDAEYLSTERLCALALQLQDLRIRLARENFSFQTVIDGINDELSAGSERLLRWQLLAKLESDYLRRFTDRPDPAAAMLTEIKNPSLPLGTDRIIAACCMELPGAAAAALENCTAKRIEFWIGAEADELDNFDRFGRPLPAAWKNCTIDIDLPSMAGCCSKPEDQADKIVEALLERKDQTKCPSVIGILDPEVAALFIDKSRRRIELPEFYLPGRRPLCGLPFTGLFLQLLELAVPDPEFPTVAALARNMFVRRFRPEEDWNAVAAALDRTQNRHLPLTLSQLNKTAEAECANFVAVVLEWQRRLNAAENLASELWDLFSEIALASEDDEKLPDSFFELIPLKETVAGTMELNPPCEEASILLKTLLKNQKVSIPGNLSGRSEIAGFLELNWRPEKHLLIAGFNEESFNYPSSEDPFLPESLRKKLGLPGRENLFAADIVRFKALNSSKILKLLYGKNSGAGEVLKPSRLLLQCSDAELPRRAAMLFSGGALAESRSQLPAAAGKYPPFLPEKRLPENKMDITGFKSYLSCPFQFYREKVLKCREIDDRAQEMSPADFGNMIHEVMRRFGANPDINGSTDPAAIERFCLKELDRWIEQSFRRGRLGIVELQKELAVGSIKAFAQQQAALAAEGWRPKATELPVQVNWADFHRTVFMNSEDNEPWREKITVSGRIDRIDQLGDKNHWRVIDYKTAAKAVDVQKAYFANSRAAAGVYRDSDSWPTECFDRYTTDDNNALWCDLQLPLYVLIMKYAPPASLVIPAGAPTVLSAYFNLPIDFRATDLQELDLKNTEITLSAMRCADAVLRRIFVEQAFWPPKKTSGNFDSFFRYIGGSLDPAEFTPNFSEWRLRP